MVDCFRTLLLVPVELIELFVWNVEILLEVKTLLSRRSFGLSGYSTSILDFGLPWTEGVGLLFLRELKGITKREREPLFFGNSSGGRALPERSEAIILVLYRFVITKDNC